MAEITTSGSDFRLHPALDGQFSGSTNGNTYSLSNGVRDWHFDVSHLGPHAILRFGDDLSALVTAIYQAGLSSAGKIVDLTNDEDKPIVITPDPETVAISGASDPSIIPGMAYLTEEQLEQLGNPNAPEMKPEELEVPPAPIAPIPKEFQ